MKLYALIVFHTGIHPKTLKKSILRNKTLFDSTLISFIIDPIW
jgi:hypothetical protein